MVVMDVCLRCEEGRRLLNNPSVMCGKCRYPVTDTSALRNAIVEHGVSGEGESSWMSV